jgi:GDP-L-fucose synthase
MAEVNSSSRITVAGATGFIGSNLVEALARRGSKVRALVHERRPASSIPDVEYVEADLRDPGNALDAMRDTDVFIMAAAKSSGAAVMANSPLAHLAPNLVMNANTAEAAVECGVKKYLFISSSTVYPPGSHAMNEAEVSGEFFPAYQVVAGMKRYSEEMLLLHESHGSTGLKVINVRPSNLYGPGDKFNDKEAKVIPSLIRRAVMRENPFSVWGDGSDVKDFLFIDDFVDALLRLIDIDFDNSEVNIAFGKSVSLGEVIREILKAAGYEDANINFDPSKPSMIPVRRLDNSRARNHLGWNPKTSLEEGILRTTDWYRSVLDREVFPR